ncbi:uncharacterized protein METZ01_LOCUS197582, partial [marine metagenome]
CCYLLGTRLPPAMLGLASIHCLI